MIEALLLAGTTPAAILGLLWGLDRLEDDLRPQPATPHQATRTVSDRRRAA